MPPEMDFLSNMRIIFMMYYLISKLIRHNQIGRKNLIVIVQYCVLVTINNN